LLLTAPRGDARSFVVEQGGRVKILQGGAITGTFLDLRNRLTAGGERGLLGLAFHPRYAENGLFYVHYSEKDNGNTQISELRVSADPDVADPASERPVFSTEQPYSNHNGGSIEFGPDGKLYIGLGDGGAGGDPENRAQNLMSPLGKILRIDVDATAGGAPYGIPSDNPFAMGGGLPEILHHGMRNPWRISFDRETGDLYMGDVGQGAVEEIALAPAGSRGLNFGWRIMEGERCYEPSASCNREGLTLPIASYDHSGGDCSVTGGYVYRGCRMPGHHGTYFHADYCTGQVRTLRWDAASGMLSSPQVDVNLGEFVGAVSSFGEDSRGEIYIVDHGGKIFRIEPAG
jgi:glucose/arabinose dehydrogenase